MGRGFQLGLRLSLRLLPMVEKARGRGEGKPEAPAGEARGGVILELTPPLSARGRHLLLLLLLRQRLHSRRRCASRKDISGTVIPARFRQRARRNKVLFWKRAGKVSALGSTRLSAGALDSYGPLEASL